MLVCITAVVEEGGEAHSVHLSSQSPDVCYKSSSNSALELYCTLHQVVLSTV